MDFHIFQLVRIFSISAFTFGITFLITPKFIELLYKFKIGKQIREETIDGHGAELYAKLHKKKKGTPTMGGLLIWGSILFVIIFTRFLSYFGVIKESLLDRGQIYLPLFTLIATGLLGAVDDYLNVKGKNKIKGITGKVKMIWLTLFSLLGAYWFYFKLDYSSIHIPRIGDFEIGYWYIPLFILVIVATSNSVNFTDGLDGLASGLLIVAFGAFGILSYAKGLFLLATFCGVIMGALSAFLWFNIPPAHFFMGDTGSLSMGATLGVIAMMTDSVLVLPIIGFIFMTETISIILQLFWKKFFKRKLFHIAPIHHHFEHIGWPEHTVVMRFWIIGACFAAIGLLIGLLGMGIDTIL